MLTIETSFLVGVCLYSYVEKIRHFQVIGRTRAICM